MFHVKHDAMRASDGRLRGQSTPSTRACAGHCRDRTTRASDALGARFGIVHARSLRGDVERSVQFGAARHSRVPRETPQCRIERTHATMFHVKRRPLWISSERRQQPPLRSDTSTGSVNVRCPSLSKGTPTTTTRQKRQQLQSDEGTRQQAQWAHHSLSRPSGIPTHADHHRVPRPEPVEGHTDHHHTPKAAAGPEQRATTSTSSVSARSRVDRTAPRRTPRVSALRSRACRRAHDPPVFSAP